MLSIPALLNDRKSLFGGLSWRPKVAKPKLIDRLQHSDETPPSMPPQPALVARLAAAIADLDARYQSWMRTQIDPRLGRQRYEQLQALGNAEFLALTPGERSANHQIALGAVTSALATVSQVLAPTFMPAVGTLALVCRQLVRIRLLHRLP